MIRAHKMPRGDECDLLGRIFDTPANAGQIEQSGRSTSRVQEAGIHGRIRGKSVHPQVIGGTKNPQGQTRAG